MSKTFTDLNFTFNVDEQCVTCRDGFCLSNATLKETGEDYNVCIYTNHDYSDIQVTASKNSSSDNENDIDNHFESESDAVEFLCSTFSNFKCF